MGDPLKSPQKSFVAEYFDCFDVDIAMRNSAHAMDSKLPTKCFYVYFLCDPIDNSIFYIGKGKGHRAKHHERNVKSGAETNGAKYLRIASILEHGKSVRVLIFATTENESEAFRIECDLIKLLRKHGLTNIANGVVNTAESSLLRARWHLSRLSPRDKYVSDHDPEFLAIYDWVVARLKASIGIYEYQVHHGK
jgi:hypothetical protein